jgi:hypothetical protein
MEPGSQGRRIEKLELPSGRSIEVVHFDAAEGKGSATAGDGGKQSTNTPRRPWAKLHMCPACERDLVNPTGWEEADSSTWAVDLRCPNCGWTGAGTFDDETIERFDRELDRGTDSIRADLAQLTRANMEEATERFAKALEADLILPEDF